LRIQPDLPTVHRMAGSKKRVGATLVAAGAAVWRAGKWVNDNLLIDAGPPNPGPYPGRNYGPHDDLTEQAYVKNWRGELKPYTPPGTRD
jgi:hypothetical protein